MNLLLPTKSETSPILRLDDGTETGSIVTSYIFDDKGTRVNVDTHTHETWDVPCLGVSIDGMRINPPAENRSHIPSLMWSIIWEAAAEGRLPADAFSG
jgi:hypothetical protein